MFQLDRFIEDCKAAVAQDPTHKAVREVVARAVSEPASVLKGLGEPSRGQLQKLHQSEGLTILNVIWAPHMTIMPHNHQMWAVIGVYTGREDNVFWRRVPGDDRRVEAAGAKALSEKDAAPLGQDIIHSVTNPIPRLTGAIHVYGGDFFAAERSEWDPATLTEQRYDAEKTMRSFDGGQDIVRRYLEAMEQRDLAKAKSFLAPGFHMTFPGDQQFTTLEQLVERSRKRYRSARKRYEHFDAVGDKVYCYGTLFGELLDGTEYSGIRFIDRFTVKDGKLVDQKVWNDMAEVLGSKVQGLK